MASTPEAGNVGPGRIGPAPSYSEIETGVPRGTLDS